MDYVASMEPPSSSAGALKSTSSHNPQLWGQVTLFMSSNGETSQRPPPLWAARHQTMHQNIKSIHPHCIPVFWDERYGRNESAQSTLCHQSIYFSSLIINSDNPSILKQRYTCEKVVLDTRIILACCAAVDICTESHQIPKNKINFCTSLHWCSFSGSLFTFLVTTRIGWHVFSTCPVWQLCIPPCVWNALFELLSL